MQNTIDQEVFDLLSEGADFFVSAVLKSNGLDPELETTVLQISCTILSGFARAAQWSETHRRAIYASTVIQTGAGYFASSSPELSTAGAIPGLYLTGLGHWAPAIVSAHDDAREELRRRLVARLVWTLYGCFKSLAMGMLQARVRPHPVNRS